jgi:hypothetical protein
MDGYQSKGKTTSIKATSRISAKINETFYTFEFTEEVAFTRPAAPDMEAEREQLWNKVHAEVDKQLEDVIAATKYKKA